jgi:glycosyltransferase involved in cell wall biosynthesis
VMTFKVLIDSRRRINSGIGRVSQWLSANLILDRQEFEVLNLTTEDNKKSDYEFYENHVVTTDIKPFSHDEFLLLPKLVASIKPDLYINPQSTWSPLHTTPSINIVHDLWAIKNPEWLPTEPDIKARFHIDGIGFFDNLSKWFTEELAKALLTEYGYKEWLNAKTMDNKIWLACWAQYAATVSMSRKCVAVSPCVKSEIIKYFRFGNDSQIIYNIPKSFEGIRDYQRNAKHFLTLSKLENRKNLDFLLDAYEQYCCEASRPIPLIIAGDPGYISVARRLLDRISRMNVSGHVVHFKQSVTDNELGDLFQHSCALIFPTLYEGFGLPALEGMLSRIPVIATKTGMMTTHLGQYASLISGNDVNELVERMVSVQNGKLNLRTTEAEAAARCFISDCNSRNEWISLIKTLRESLAH